MTIMIESSRSFLFTEYARTGCGTFKNQGTDPKVWDALPVCCYECYSSQVQSDRNFQDKFSSYPNIQEILKQVRSDNEARKQRLEAYYDDDLLAQLVRH
jgi:homogentisate 1,2-dioxygenase